MNISSFVKKIRYCIVFENGLTESIESNKQLLINFQHNHEYFNKNHKNSNWLSFLMTIKDIKTLYFLNIILSFHKIVKLSLKIYFC